jgi:hypothetical protein
VQRLFSASGEGGGGVTVNVGKPIGGPEGRKIVGQNARVVRGSVMCRHIHEVGDVVAEKMDNEDSWEEREKDGMVAEGVVRRKGWTSGRGTIR